VPGAVGYVETQRVVLFTGVDSTARRGHTQMQDLLVVVGFALRF